MFNDLMQTKWDIFGGLLVAMFSCLIVIAAMRWVATPIVWLSILGMITMLGYGELPQLFYIWTSNNE